MSVPSSQKVCLGTGGSAVQLLSQPVTDSHIDIPLRSHVLQGRGGGWQPGRAAPGTGCVDSLFT